MMSRVGPNLCSRKDKGLLTVASERELMCVCVCVCVGVYVEVCIYMGYVCVGNMGM